MSNNRMWLVNPRNNRRVLLAKYYPDTGWVTFSTLMERLDEFFAADEGRSFSHAGETDWRLEYDDSGQQEEL